MKFSIRRNVFETNSSSTHSITICSELDYGKWKKGKMLWDYENDKIVPIPENWRELPLDEYGNYYEDYEEWEDYEDYEYENLYTYKRYINFIETSETYEEFEETYTTESGDKVKVFGYYGNDY